MREVQQLTRPCTISACSAQGAGTDLESGRQLAEADRDGANAAGRQHAQRARGACDVPELVRQLPRRRQPLSRRGEQCRLRRTIYLQASGA